MDGSQFFDLYMDITVPKKRNPAIWKQNQKKLAKPTPTIRFKDYCELSLLFVEADNDVFLTQKYPDHLQLLKNPTITYTAGRGAQSKNDEAKKQEMTAQRIGKALGYHWKNIMQLIKGNNGLSESDQTYGTSVYSMENINLQFARLESMLLQLKSNKYRCGIYIKENAYVREMMEKEMEEEIVFIKLLQNILQTQTKRIQEARMNYQRQPQYTPAEMAEEVVEELQDIGKVVKVNEYFERKLAIKDRENTTKDPIDLLQQNRKFNAAAVRYHLHHSHARR